MAMKCDMLIRVTSDCHNRRLMCLYFCYELIIADDGCCLPPCLPPFTSLLETGNGGVQRGGAQSLTFSPQTTLYDDDGE